MRKIYALVVLVLCAVGCASHSSVVKKTNIEEPLAVTGNCVDAAKLKAGGKLGVLAFKAGPQAEANDTLDHLSAMLIKGIQDRLEGNKETLQITNQESKADLVLEGYIEEFSTPGRFSRLMLRKKNARLATSGEIWSKANGLKVLTFAASVFIAPKASVDDAAYHMGQAIGDFILEKIK